MALPPVPKSPSVAPPSPRGPPIAVDGVAAPADNVEELTERQANDDINDVPAVRGMIECLDGQVIQLCQLSHAQTPSAERIRVRTVSASRVAQSFANVVNDRSNEVLALTASYEVKIDKLTAERDDAQRTMDQAIHDVF